MSNENKFEVGDIVRLKSGGPDMTVQGMCDFVNHDDEYQCQWFAGKKLEQGHFPAESLVRVPSEEG